MSFLCPADPAEVKEIQLSDGNTLAGGGYAIPGLDVSAATIEDCRRLSAGQPNASTLEVADL